jgi:PPIC-type PPIASE domain.
MHLLLLLNKKRSLFILILLFIFYFIKVNSNINNSVIISVGNQPITYLDLIKEMRLISFLNNIKVDESNRETVKSVAVQGLITRKIKEIEINKFKIKQFNKADLQSLINRTSQKLGTTEKGLEKILLQKNLSINNLQERFEIDLKWNTLIFQLYKNKVVLNTNEMENKIRYEMENIKERRMFLLSEIEINRTQNNDATTLDDIFKNIEVEGFENTAKKFSISKSAQYGGNIGWINENNLSKKIYEKIKFLKTEEISKPIY